MSWTFVLRPREMESFWSCRRAWDFESRVRQNYVPVTPTRVFDFEKAMHVGLAVYYFPAMDDWNRSIVRPLALQGFERAMRDDRTGYEETTSLTPEQDADWNLFLTLGHRVLNRYFDWAAPADDFESILADEDIWVPVLDPWNPGLELGTPDGHPIRYFGRLDQLISDAQDEYWVVRHRVVWDDWGDDQAMLDDDEALRCQWAVETSYPQLRVAGTIYNELRVDRADVDVAGAGGDDVRQAAESAVRDLRDMTRGVRHLNTRRSPLTPAGKDLTLPLPDEDLNRVYEVPIQTDDRDHLSQREGNDYVRRTWVRRARLSVPKAHLQIVDHVLEVREPDVDVSPSPSEEKCARCVFLKPCKALNEGVDIAPIMASEYRKRSAEDFEEEGLRWSPNRRAQRASLGGRAQRPGTVNFRWG